MWKSPRRGVRGDPTLRWRELPSARASEPSGLSGGGLHLRAGGQGWNGEPPGRNGHPAAGADELAWGVQASRPRRRGSTDGRAGGQHSRAGWPCLGWGCGAAATRWHLAASPSRFLPGGDSDSFPAGPSGKFPTVQLDLLALPREARNLSTSFSKASVVSSRGQKPQVDSDPPGLAQAMLCSVSQSLGPGSPTEDMAEALSFPSQFGPSCPTLNVPSVGGRLSVVSKTTPSLQANKTPSLGVPSPSGTGLRPFQEQKVISARSAPGAQGQRGWKATVPLKKSSDQTPAWGVS